MPRATVAADPPAEAPSSAAAAVPWPDVPRPAATVDVVVLTILDGRLHVLLIERAVPPFVGRRALPGGFVRVGTGGAGGESLDAAATRELFEETRLPPERVLLRPLAVFGAPGRDPRGRVITFAYLALVPPALASLVQGGTDARSAAFVDVAAAQGLAFDHDAILAAARARLRDDVERGEPVAFALAPDPFTIAELHAVHEILLGSPVPPATFRRRFTRLQEDGRVAVAPGRRVTGRRPARVYTAARPSGHSGNHLH
jgi:8-oxo-dGTP diphosphatase